jgi:hypothetical protein
MMFKIVFHRDVVGWVHDLLNSRARLFTCGEADRSSNGSRCCCCCSSSCCLNNSDKVPLAKKITT